MPKYDYDLAKAKQLLDAAGWRAPANDPNGTRVKDGKPLKMRIFYNAGNKEREQLATVAQQYAKAVGVELEVISEEWNAYLNRVNKTRDMEMYVLGWSSRIEPHGMQNIWITEGAQNATGFSNPQVDELFPKAGTVAGLQPGRPQEALRRDPEAHLRRSAVHLYVGGREPRAVEQPLRANKLTSSGTATGPGSGTPRPGSSVSDLARTTQLRGGRRDRRAAFRGIQTHGPLRLPPRAAGRSRCCW